MKYKINWKNIKDGCKGFETLAVRYVKMKYDSDFERTKQTRDGNKDAVLKLDYTIIFGYQSSPNTTEEWWMEAKYSDSKEVIKRYRLDATIVSAILKGNVGRIIFVTNMNILCQTMNDIRQALIASTSCREVNFCTRNTLEYWLYQNTEILREYFSDYQGQEIDLDDLILLDNVKFYSPMEICYSFKEDLNVIDLGQVYHAIFSVFSKNTQTVSLQADRSLKGIRILDSKQFVLQQGVNDLQFSFLLKEGYGYKSKKRQEEHMLLPGPIFCFGNIQLTSENKAAVNKSPIENFVIKSQKNMEKEIINFFSKQNKTGGVYLFYLHGHSGVGKSRVLNNYISSKKHAPLPCFYCEMSGGYQQDLKYIIDCINYIYFPFLPSEEITIEYLRQIENNNYFPTFYKDIIGCRNNEKELNKIILKYISEDMELFPIRIYVNQRQIIIDNLHKTNSLFINFLYKMMIELFNKDAPVQIIFSGQWISYTNIYTKMRAIVTIKEMELQITEEDCLSLLPAQMVNAKLKVFLSSGHLFSNIIELFMFTFYLREHDKKIQDFDTFQIIYHLFFRENIMEAYIKRLLDSAVSNNPKADQLCNQVYWNILGIPRNDTEEERMLLRYHVVKLDSTGQRIIPYHDLYAKCYRKYYVYNQLSNVPFVQLLQHGRYLDIKTIADKLHEEYQQKNYILVYYTLEPIFKDDSLSYRNLMDDTTYFTLFQDFAHSCAFCSIDYSGSNLFTKIYKETKNLCNPTPQIRLIQNAALWELTNSAFESLDYEKSLNLCRELLNDTKRLVEYGIMSGTTEDSVRFHNANVIKSMIKSEMKENDNEKFFRDSEQKMIKYQKEDRLWSFRVRYSLTMMQEKPEGALQLLEECRKYYETLNNKSEKYYLWSSFYISYIKMIIEENLSIRYQAETEALSILEKMKDLYFNDYRKMLYGMVLYLYYCNRKDEADLYLSKDCYVLRDKRPRLKGFEHLVLALRHIKEKENPAALNELKNAYAIFKHIPSYGNLIKHNINLIEADIQKTFTHIEYYFGGEMENDTYYLDVRGCW